MKITKINREIAGRAEPVSLVKGHTVVSIVCLGDEFLVCSRRRYINTSPEKL